MQAKGLEVLKWDEGDVELRNVTRIGVSDAAMLVIPKQHVAEVAEAILPVMYCSVCPVCGYTGVVGESVTVTASGASQECACQSCEASWMLEFRATSCTNVIQGS